MQKGEELWTNEFLWPCNGSYVAYWGRYRHRKRTQFSPKKLKDKSIFQPETNKQKWATYVEERSVGDRKLSEEPQDGIKQTDSKTSNQLLPPTLPQPNPKYGNRTKLFNQTDVQSLAF